MKLRLLLFGSLLLIISIFAYFYIQNIRENKLYTSKLLTIANKLGYSIANHIDTRQDKTYGPDAYYNLIHIIYFTDLTYEEFREQVNTLGYQQKYVNSTDGSEFLHSINSNETREEKRLYLGSHYGLKYTGPYNGTTIEKPIPLDEQPKVTEWTLITPEGKELDVIYADTNLNKDPWILNKKEVPGNIVEVSYRIY